MAAEAPDIPPIERREALLSIAAVALFTLFGAATRAITLARWPLSFDEVSTLMGTRAGPVDTLRWLHHYEHPPLSYILVRAAMVLSGSTTEWVVRLPSFLAGVLCIPAFYLLGRVIHSPRLGVAMAALAAVDPILVSQARQARMYSLLALATILLLAVTAAFVRRRVASPWAWLGWAGILTACYWAHALGLVVWLAAALSFAIWAIGLKLRREPLPRGVLSGAALGFIFAIAVSHVGLAILASRAAFAFGNEKRGSAATDAGAETIAALGTVFASPLLGLLLVALAVPGVIVLTRRHPLPGVLTALLGVGGTAAIAIARTDHHTMDPRYFVLLSLACTVAAASLTALPRPRAVRATATMGVVVLVLVGAWHAAHPRMAYYHEVATMARLASRVAQASDEVYFYHEVSRRLADYYPVPSHYGNRAAAAWPPPKPEHTYIVFSYLDPATEADLARLVVGLAAQHEVSLAEPVLLDALHAQPALLMRLNATGAAVRGPYDEDWRALE